MTETLYPPFPVMLVDDENQALNSFEMALRSSGMNHFIRCEDSRRVMTQLSDCETEVLLLDLRMPHLSGEELLPMITSDFPDVPVIVVTGANDVETAVRCMQQGAFDYMVKPIEKNRLVACVRRAVEIRELRRENRRLSAHVLGHRLEHPEAFSEIITRSAGMHSIFKYIEAVSANPRPLLITGETGVGKELIARAVHTLSRRKGSFVAVNVAGLDDNVFADSLFGHKKGAFTGADQARGGLVEQASGGTLFLDEIGDLSSLSQVKLLRLLQNGEYFPVGSDVAKRSDARVVVATNQDLDALQGTGRFRKDLYYRLCGHRVSIPPLRDRREDIPVLIEHFLEKASKMLDMKKPSYPKELPGLLSVYHFPGNVRELESMILDALSSHRSAILSMKTFRAYIGQKKPLPQTDAVEPAKKEKASITFSDRLPTLKEAEHVLIAEAMSRAKGNQAVAALTLGITRQALNKRLKSERR